MITLREPDDTTPAGRYCRDCFPPGGEPAIRNVRTRMAVVDIDGLHMPLTINRGDEAADATEGNSWVVAPLSAYGDYALDEIRRLRNAWLTWPLSALVRALRALLRAARLDAMVQVNNWLLSTNIYPDGWRGENTEALTQTLVGAFPDCAIGFRSLNDAAHADLIQALARAGYVKVPSRQVYLTDARDAARNVMKLPENKRDAALLARSPFQLAAGADFDTADFARAETLYNLLYLDKYCRLNPQFSAAWLEAGQRHGWLELTGLRNAQGTLDGVVGCFTADSTQTTPILGYNTALPASAGLYRQLTMLTLQRALATGVLLNRSSGAAHFKRLRGAVPAIEYSLVYVRHLAPPRRIAWHALNAVLQALGVPLMRRLKL